MSSTTLRVLFVCLGNICRSPMAEAIFRHLVKEAGLEETIDVESAGTGGWHAGERPHSGTRAVLQAHQIEIGGKRARQLSRADLTNFDYIIAMDAENVSDIQSLFGRRVPRLLEFAKQNSEFAQRNSEFAKRNSETSPPGAILDVPDPYYTNTFDEVYSLVLAGCRGLLDHIRAEHNL